MPVQDSVLGLSDCAGTCCLPPVAMSPAINPRLLNCNSVQRKIWDSLCSCPPPPPRAIDASSRDGTAGTGFVFENVRVFLSAGRVKWCPGFQAGVTVSLKRRQSFRICYGALQGAPDPELASTSTSRAAQLRVEYPGNVQSQNYAAMHAGPGTPHRGLSASSDNQNARAGLQDLFVFENCKRHLPDRI